ncbi:MAG: hypothetical protein M3Z17_05525 [Gemmatimonadota bacterium]|nr:hypothetical protein [Gemmatimonadota bacterium]
MKTNGLIVAALIVAAVSACKVDMRDSGVSDAAVGGDTDVTGTYFAADSGHNLGKDWCYSGALVLDSTRHFGSVITMCSDDGSGPVTEHIKGSYHLNTVTTRVKGQRAKVRRIDVVLDQDGARRKTHTLRYDNGTLRFDEPWWLGAGLRALEVSDPVLKRIPASQLGDSTTAATASSTPLSAGSAVTRPKKSSSRLPAKK